MKYDVLNWLLLAISVFSYRVNAGESGTCLISPEIPNQFFGILKSFSEWELLEKYDVSNITMTVLSPQNLTLLEEITIGDEFKAKGCCGKRTLFTHHGWKESKDQLWNTQLQMQYVTATQGCAVAFDYSGAAEENYFNTVKNDIDNIGRECARKVYKTFVETGCLAPEDIIYMGFSLGAPIAMRNAYAMINTYGSTINAIYCMDPAGPVFNTNIDPPETFYYEEVSKNISQLQCIHTSTTFGTDTYNLCPSTIVIGDDNGSQPECADLMIRAGCDHTIAPSFLIASYIKPGSILAKKCYEDNTGTANIICTNETEVVGYQTSFKNGQFRHYHPGECIDIYYS